VSPAALRRTLHAASAGLLLVAVIGSWDLCRVTIFGLAALAAILETVRLGRPEFRDFLARHMPAFRPTEWSSPSGPLWLAFGLAAAAFFTPPAAVVGILAGTLGDPAASLVGARFGGGARKSWAGTGAAALVILLAALALRVAWVPALVAAVTGAALERWSAPLDDNLVIAPGVALVVRLLA
jgi:dolichol kinase